MLAAGVTRRITSQMLGHSRVGITLDFYSHVLPGLQEDAALLTRRCPRRYNVRQKQKRSNQLFRDGAAFKGLERWQSG
jgi:hypothetical protein